MGVRVMTTQAIMRLKAIELPSRDYEPDLIRFINIKSFESCVQNEVRCHIMSLIAKGISSAAEIASELNIARTAIYRHLNMMEKSGLIVHYNNRFYVAARFFFVFDVDVDADGIIKIQVFPDRGGFVDENLGFVLVKGPYCRCDICVYKDSCLKAVKNLAKKLNIKIRSESPLEAFREIVATIAQRDVVNIIRRGYMIVKVPEVES